MCVAGTVVAFWLVAQEVAGSSPFTVMKNIFVTEFSESSENILEKLHCTCTGQRVNTGASDMCDFLSISI